MGRETVGTSKIEGITAALRVWMLGTVLLAGVIPAIAQGPDGDGPGVIPGQYIVVMKQGSRPGELAAWYKTLPAQVFNYALKGFAGPLTPAQLQALRNDPRVAWVEPDREVRGAAQTLPTGVNRIEADLSDIARINGVTEQLDVDIAIVDSGIDPDHPDLKVVDFVNFVDTLNDDGHGHGTHVAGIAAALDNSYGTVGVAPGARLWAVKVLNSSNQGTLSGLLKGIDYVTQHAGEIEVANLSLILQGRSDALRSAIQASVAAGVVYTVAAGNQGKDVYGADGVFDTSDDYIPAAYPEVAAVSNLQDYDGRAGGLANSYDDRLATSSNYARSVAPGNPVTSLGAAIDLVGPGTNIYSTYKDGKYAKMTGTSMASPHVAGSAALYVAVHGRAKDAAGVYAIRQALINAAEPQSAWRTGGTGDPDANPEGLVRAPVKPVNTPPVVVVQSPADNTRYLSGTAILLEGTASDAEDGDLTSQITWSSDRDGQLGIGGSLFIVLSDGTHTITASVCDASGARATACVSVRITSSLTNEPPTVFIVSPVDGAVYGIADLIRFQGTASDVEDGNLSAALTWTSDRDGVIGTGSSFTTALSVGVHTITASVNDWDDASGSAAVSLTVTAPSLAVTVVSNKLTYRTGETAALTVTVRQGTAVISGAAVHLDLTTANGRVVSFDRVTDSTGKVVFKYKLDVTRDGAGTYLALVTASKSGYQSGTGSVSFQVTK